MVNDAIMHFSMLQYSRATYVHVCEKSHLIFLSFVLLLSNVDEINVNYAINCRANRRGK